MARRPRATFDEDAIELLAAAPAGIDDAIDLSALLSKLSDEVPDWARDVVLSALLEK